MSPCTPNDRQRRIIQLSQQWDIVLPPAPAPLTRPPHAPSFRTSADDQTAEDLMQRRAADAAQYRPKSGLRHAFSSGNLKKGKNWDPRETLEVLTAWVANAGSPGVAEALIAKLAAAGVDLGASQKHKTGILSRRRSVDSFEDRARLLRLAVDGRQYDLAQVLLPHADSFAIDACLPAAIRGGDTAMVELLLAYGASAAQSPDGQDAFRQACVIHGQSHLISLVLRSDGRPPPAWTSASMCDAARAGCLETVLHLSRSTADGNHNQAEALKSAVSSARRDIALAIVMGNRPPQRPGLDEAFQMLHDHSTLSPSMKLDLAELLLCAGADGLVVAQALEKSYQSHSVEMATLLAAYGASVEYNDAAVLKTAISRGQVHLVESLLRDGAVLSPALASSCVPLIEKQAPFDQRHAILSLLLRKGANGVVLDDMLIDAAEAGDMSSLDLLLTPYFSLPPHASPSPHSPTARNKHEIASVDHKSGEALRTTVLRGDIEMTQTLLARHPSQQTLSAVFPFTRKLSNVDRYQMVELFLQRSLSGPCLHAALHDAINEDVSKRDNSLIKLLLRYDADVNYSQGSGLSSLIKQKDMELLGALLQKASPQTAAARMQDVMQVSDHRVRYDMMILLLNAGAVIGVQEVATALLGALSEKPVDMSLLRLLLREGGADVNLLDGAVVKQAVVNPDPKVLEEVLGQGTPSASSITHSLRELVPLSSTEGKARKLNMILSKSTRQEDLSWVLVHEVQSVARGSAETASLSTLKRLLASGADPNAYNAAALCHAVIAAKMQIVDILFNCGVPPSPPALGAALPHVLRIPEPMERLTLAKKLVQAGASPLEINRALTHAISTYPTDISLLSALAAGADTSDGEALGLSASMESPQVMDLLLARSKSSVEVRSSALAKVMGIKDRVARGKMGQSLLAAGVSTESTSSALLIAARDGDLMLGDVLIAHGASITSNDGQAIVEACRGGSVEVLGVLLKADADTSMKTLLAGFQAATEVGSLGKRAVIFEHLLKRGVSGEAVDAQLESAARSGDDGQAVLNVLLASGADPNFNNGECVVLATRSAFVGSLDLLLGLSHEGRNRKRVSQLNLVRALKACWGLERDSRYRVVCSLVKAGLQVTEDLHTALNDAVNEEDPEERLIRLLLNHGASPSANGCKTLVDAARSMSPSSLALLLQRELSKEDITQAFSQAFASNNFDDWFTEVGIETAKLLLSRGVHAEALSCALVSIMKRSTPESRDFANPFFDLLMAHEPDVDYNDGELLQQAASMADVPWTAKLLECHPSAHALSVAFQCIFDTVLTQDGVLDLFKMFAEYQHGEVGIDVMIGLPGSEPVLVRAIKQYPRSTAVLSTLLDAGFYHDQATTCSIGPEMEEEEVTLLLWAIAQPQKRVSSAVIELLVERGAKVNAEASMSRSTPLMIAVQSKRPDLVKLLLLEGADVDALDSQGRTPLSMATNMGGDIAVQMMTSLLAAEPARDDGSLHNAARDLNYAAVKILVQSGHDPDFPSPLHGGRSALGEVCLRGSDAGEMTAEKERTMQRVMAFLIGSNSDLTLESNGKSLLHLCFDAADPVVTSRALLKSGMWKHVNKPFNHLVFEGYTYSPTMYISRALAPSNSNAELLSVLRASRATDVFYANEGPQPDGAVGLPEDMEVQERARKARLARMAEDTEDFSIALARKREIAGVEQQIAAQKAEMDDARRRKLHGEEIASLRSRAQLEESIAGAAHQRRLAEQHAIADASIGRSRALAATELEAAESRQRKALEWETKLNTERTDNARALSSIRISERQELERVEQGAEARIKNRLEAQRKLVESQEKLAKRLADGQPGGAAMGNARRQIGYVTELN
ncbi:ankyrin repeats (3 copies) domain-containing protein [Hirsutella rhossiliensis]|uniref:Ankyrin repeats (3 copies) domain-containing protein n=1 Tax=Hirsutella rhossiliensis TaxID=111463 RepID=A0A9P8MVL8_9HYPO|nr:ankyrin repeats (3 copies) domain-containing protein [Hirsutella rhossiliensis]KAH0961061.1 ankyrin repeats (3 copies) domain-containing protein [Hirsutella rhossiliensis]